MDIKLNVFTREQSAEETILRLKASVMDEDFGIVREIVDKSVQLSIKKEDFTFNLIRLNENIFLKTLREKLTWGFDTRNR